MKVRLYFGVEYAPGINKAPTRLVPEASTKTLTNRTASWFGGWGHPWNINVTDQLSVYNSLRQTGFNVFDVFLRKKVSEYLLPFHPIRSTLICAALVFATQSAIKNLPQSVERFLGNLCD